MQEQKMNELKMQDQKMQEEKVKEQKNNTDIIKPTLQTYHTPSRLSEYPQATCYQAGHLVTKNAGWRNVRPVIDQGKCRFCLQCYQFCPDGVIRKKNQKVEIDYDFCKGCGICAKSCPFHAIEMEDEK